MLGIKIVTSQVSDLSFWGEPKYSRSEAVIFIAISSARQRLVSQIIPLITLIKDHLISRNHVWYIMAKRIRKAGLSGNHIIISWD